MTKEEAIKSFDPNGSGIKGNLFGLPYSVDNAEVVVVPVPWEVTVSYQEGTASGPKAILNASTQIDFVIKEIPEAWKLGISMSAYPQKLFDENRQLRELALKYLSHHQKAEDNNTIRNKISDKVTDKNKLLLTKINEASESLNIYVKNTTQQLLDEGKLVGLLGGDHSTPLGFIRALSEKYNQFGILHIDAHADLRKAYEGFTYSHGSIMYNALKIPAVQRLVQVGIRDYCEEELNLINRSQGRIKTFFDEDIKAAQYTGKTWETICHNIIKELPPLVYISLDIDGLDPRLCPNTGTPVPGGLEFNQVTYLIKLLAKSGKKIIGFDLNEVAPGKGDDEWDANVGARLLYQLCNWMAASQGKFSTPNK